MKLQDVKPRLFEISRVVVLGAASLSIALLIAWIYFVRQTSVTEKQIVYGKAQMQEAGGILAIGPSVLAELRAKAKTNETFRALLFANGYPMEPTVLQSGVP